MNRGKFQSIDRAYFARRNRFAQKYDDAAWWFIADNWPLFAGRANLARFLAIYELAKQAAQRPGHFCELGCWHGTNLVFLAKILQILKPDSHTELIGFDSFQGLRQFHERDGQLRHRPHGKYQGNHRLLKDVLRLHHLEREVQVVKGPIERTLPRWLTQRRDIRFAFVYVDVDLYEPTKLGIEWLYPRLLKGGVMVFDQYNMPQWPGETSAVHEMLGADVQLLQVPGTRQPIAYLVK